MAGDGGHGEIGGSGKPYPKAQSRPEDTAVVRSQTRSAWIIAILVLIAFVFVTSILIR